MFNLEEVYSPPGNEEGIADGKLVVPPPGMLGVARDTIGVAKFWFEVRAWFCNKYGIYLC